MKMGVNPLLSTDIARRCSGRDPPPGGSRRDGGWGPHLINYHDRQIQADILAVLTDLAANGLWYPDADDMDELIEIYHPGVRAPATPIEGEK